MSKTALLFAGQGAQFVGMGRDFAAAVPSAKAWFERANADLGYDLASICFNGPEAELTKTENAQPGIFLVSWVCFELLKELVQGPKSKVQSPRVRSLTGPPTIMEVGPLDFACLLLPHRRAQHVVKPVADPAERLQPLVKR